MPSGHGPGGFWSGDAELHHGREELGFEAEFLDAEDGCSYTEVTSESPGQTVSKEVSR